MNTSPPQPGIQNKHAEILTRIIPWSHQLVREVLQPGDLALDLTAGKGRDTLALAQKVGPNGQVISFDIQASALEQTRTFLQSRGIEARYATDRDNITDIPGIFLVKSCHGKLGSFVQHPPKGIIANLGYLPGGDRAIITRPNSTFLALKQSTELLATGGRIAVTVYSAHSGGDQEAEMVTKFFRGLPREKWQVLQMSVANRSDAPYLMVAEKQC